MFICIMLINKMDNNKKQSRVLVNVLGIPLLLSAIYFGGIYFQCLIFIAIIMSTFELNAMCLKKNIQIQLLPIFLFYIYLFLTHLFESISVNIEILIFWSLLILSFEVFRKKVKPIENIAISILGMVWIGLFMNSIVSIRYIDTGWDISGGMYTLLMFLSVWICDSAAFIFGSKFGKTKILPNISPNKTWVGAVSGAISVFIFTIIVAFFIFFPNHGLDYYFPILTALILTLIFGVIGQIGDFVESMIKRQFGVKDSGTSLKGHGGFLDRMDSLMLAAPSFYLFLKYSLRDIIG